MMGGDAPPVDILTCHSGFVESHKKEKRR